MSKKWYNLFVSIDQPAEESAETDGEHAPASGTQGSAAQAVADIAASISKETVPDVTAVSPLAVKVRVRAPTTPVILRLVNVAKQLAPVLAVSVPPSVPPPVAMAAVMVVPDWLTGFPTESWI